jgi:hypothetical protein
MATARNAVAITPHDTNANLADALYVGTAGDLEIQAFGSSAAVVLVAVPAGTFVPIRVVKVLATNTTADDIVGLKL